MKKWVIIIVSASLLVVAGLYLAPFLLPKPDDRLPVGARFPFFWDPGYRFWAGINYPWKSYQDFGTGAWGHSGVSNPAVYEEIDTDFANMAATGVQVAKWRVFNDGRYSPDFAEDGSVLGLDEYFLKDVDAALEIAAKHDIYLVLSLLDSGLWTVACERDRVQIGGHADLITDAAKRRSLIEKAIVPLVRHVSSRGRVVAYEVIAEPEWGITELHTEDDGRVTVPLAEVQAFVREAAEAIHGNGGGLVTVESNRSSNMQHWQGLGLDYYSFSWYDWVQPYDPLDVSARSHGLDRPVVLGEFPIQESQYYDFHQVLDIALGQGYAGAFVWSYSGADKYGSLRNVHGAYARWLSGRWQTADLSRGGVQPPAPEAQLLPPPFSYQDVQLAADGKGVSVDVGLSVREGGTFHVQFFLYPFNGRPNQPVADRSLSLQSGAQGTLHLKLSQLPSDKLYRLSMAIFDDQWQIRKWFDSITIFSVQDGLIVHPSLSDLEKENPCGSPKR